MLISERALLLIILKLAGHSVCLSAHHRLPKLFIAGLDGCATSHKSQVIPVEDKKAQKPRFCQFAPPVLPETSVYETWKSCPMNFENVRRRGPIKAKQMSKVDFQMSWMSGKALKDFIFTAKTKLCLKGRRFRRPLYSMGASKRNGYTAQILISYGIPCSFQYLHMDAILYWGKTFLCTRFGVKLQLLGVNFMFKSLCPGGHDKTQMT